MNATRSLGAAAAVNGFSTRPGNVENEVTRAPTLRAHEPGATGEERAPAPGAWTTEARRVGTVLAGRWTLERVIGVGGTATVYAARHRNGSRVAIKVLHPEHTAVDAVRGRFLFEAFVANWIGHPGTVLVHDEGIAEDGAVFLVMELLDGESLAEKIARRPSGLPLQEVLAIIDQLLDVLASVHESGIVHRDVKPDNVFITRDGCVKLLDFGVAHVRAWSLYRPTLPGATVGTPCFMPPEQALGSTDIDHRADLWAVGATMFTALTGKPVHEANDIFGELALTVSLPARQVRSVEPSIPPLVAATIDRALSKEAAERWPNARAMRCALREARERECGIELASAPRGARRPSPALSAAVVIAVCAVGVLGLSVPTGRPEPLSSSSTAADAPEAVVVVAEDAEETSLATVALDPSLPRAPAEEADAQEDDPTPSSSAQTAVKRPAESAQRVLERGAAHRTRSRVRSAPHSVRPVASRATPSRFWAATRDPLARRK